MYDINALYQHLLCDLAYYDNPASNSLRQSFLKKFEGRDNTEVWTTSRNKAIELFKEYNDRNLSWEADHIYKSTARNKAILDRAARLLNEWFPPYDDILTYIKENGEFGPGSTLGVSGTSYVEKTGTGTLTASSRSIYKEFMSARATDFTSFFAVMKQLKEGGMRLGVASNITTVPKTSEIDRCIAIEPLCNMFLQRGFGKYIDYKLKIHTGYDNRVQQDRNRRLAQMGSVTQQYGTIDLASASDTISLRLCRWLLPEHMFKYACFLRSKYSVVKYEDGSSERVLLNMVGTMGNGFTFSLQTAIFSAITIAAIRETCGFMPKQIGIKQTMFHGKYFGVFGDDIIVPERAYGHLCGALRVAGFVVNAKKSFGVGPFRESCGGDYHLGRNIRPVYLRTFASTRDVYSVANRLMVWSARHVMPLQATMTYLTSLVEKPRFIPPAHSADGGFCVPLYYIQSLGLLNRDHNRSIVYTALEERADKVKVEKLTSNQHAILYSILHGAVQSRLADVKIRGDGFVMPVKAGVMTVTVRKNKIGSLACRLSHRRYVTPCWDYVPSNVSESVYRDVDMGMWELMVVETLPTIV